MTLSRGCKHGRRCAAWSGSPRSTPLWGGGGYCRVYLVTGPFNKNPRFTSKPPPQKKQAKKAAHLPVLRCNGQKDGRPLVLLRWVESSLLKRSLSLSLSTGQQRTIPMDRVGPGAPRSLTGFGFTTQVRRNGQFGPMSTRVFFFYFFYFFLNVVCKSGQM